MAASKTLLRALCKRFHGAAEARAEAVKAGKQPEGEKPSSKRPFELEPGARVVAEYHLEWPCDLAGKEKLTGVPLDRMTIHYVRIEENAKPQTLLGLYRRKMSWTEHPLEDGLWLEYFRTIPKTDRKSSIDLLITLPKDSMGRSTTSKDAEKPPDTEMDLVVQLLSLEIKDPEASPGQEPAAKSEPEAKADDQNR